MTTTQPTPPAGLQERCKHCFWPIVPEGEAGCWKSNCSMRPIPPIHNHAALSATQTTPPAGGVEEIELEMMKSVILNASISMKINERKKDVQIMGLLTPIAKAALSASKPEPSAEMAWKKLSADMLEVAEHLQVDNGHLTASEQYDLGEQLYSAINEYESSQHAEIRERGKV